jgi:hypothetical protein
VADAFARARALELLVGNALVGRVHVDQHETLPILGQHVDAAELRQCETEWRHVRIIRHRQRRATRHGIGAVVSRKAIAE